MDAEHVAKETQVRKFRLGAGPVPVIKAQVEAEIVQTSDLDKWYEKALGHGGDHFKELQVKLAKFLAAKIQFIEDAAERKEMFSKIRGITEKVYDEELVEFVLDAQTPSEYGRKMVERYSLGTGRYVGAAKYQLGQAAEWALDKKSLFSTWFWCQKAFTEGKFEDYLTGLSVLKPLILAVEHMFATSLSVMRKQSRYWEFLSLVRTDRFDSAEKLMEGLDETDVDVFSSKLTIFKALGKLEEIVGLLERALCLDHSPLLMVELGWTHFQLKKYSEALELLEEADILSPDTPRVLYSLARVHWALSHEDVALNLLLRTVKTDPEHSEAFMYLGFYYAKRQDKIRAEKCFVKALKLNGDLVDAAVHLASIWISLAWQKLEERKNTGLKVVRLLDPFKSDNLRNWRLWKYLGIALDWSGNLAKSITAFQTALKAEHADEVEVLLLLADSYRKDKKLTSSSKAFARALEVRPESVLARIGLATVQMETKLFDEAMCNFDGLLGSVEPQLFDNIKTLKAKNCLLHAQELLRESEFESAIGKLCSGLEVLSTFICSSSSFSAWKVFSDLSRQLAIYSATENVSGLLQPILLHLEKFSDLPFAGEIVGHLKGEALRCAALGLAKCLTLSPNDSLTSDLWLGIGEIGFKEYTSTSTPSLLDICETCVTQALNHNRAQFEAWNLYGLVAIEQGRFPLAQHCFIASLEQAGSDLSHVWVNLALLYCKLGDTELALQSIERAQMGDVENPLSWFAQAQLEASPTKTADRLNEAIQCSRASILPDINSAYVRAFWPKLASVEDYVEKRNLVDDLALALKRIVALCPSHAHFTNLYGMALEMQNRTEQASCVFSQALLLTNDEQSAAVKTNLFRSQICSRQFDADSNGSIDDEMTRFLLSVGSGNTKRQLKDLEHFTTAAVHQSNKNLWQCAIWECTKCFFSRNESVSPFIERMLQIDPESMIALILRMVTLEDADEAEACLMQVLELLTSSSIPPQEEVLWTIERYLFSRNCHMEAFQLHMSILDEHALDQILWESLAVLLDEMRSDETVEESKKEEVIIGLKQWLDIQVPQLERKPTLAQMESWYDRFFPPLASPSDKATVNLPVDSAEDGPNIS